MLWWRVSPLHSANTYTLTNTPRNRGCLPAHLVCTWSIAAWYTGKSKGVGSSPRKSIYTFERPTMSIPIFQFYWLLPIAVKVNSLPEGYLDANQFSVVVSNEIGSVTIPFSIAQEKPKKQGIKQRNWHICCNTY
jgi:hypothetical protein